MHVLGAPANTFLTARCLRRGPTCARGPKIKIGLVHVQNCLAHCPVLLQLFERVTALDFVLHRVHVLGLLVHLLERESCGINVVLDSLRHNTNKCFLLKFVSQLAQCEARIDAELLEKDIYVLARYLLRNAATSRSFR